MEKTTAENINLFEPSLLEVFLDETHNMAVRNKEDGQTYEGLRVSLMFPITDRYSYVQFLDADENEIGILKDLNELDNESRSILMSEIEKTYFIPAITKILSIEAEFRADVWKVETDKGFRTFEVVGKRRNIRYVTSDHVIIKDIDGNRYEIPSVNKLDKTSKKLLQREV